MDSIFINRVYCIDAFLKKNSYQTIVVISFPCFLMIKLNACTFHYLCPCTQDAQLTQILPLLILPVTQVVRLSPALSFC